MYKYLGIYIVLTCITCIWVVRNTRNRLDIDELIYAVFTSYSPKKNHAYNETIIK